MKYNFDELIDRRNTDCIKYDFAYERGKPKDVLPFWVADMDFKSPPEVIDALVKRCEHGIFGYTDPKDDYFDSVIDWFGKVHSLNLNREWIVATAGVVFAINCAIRAFTKEGDGVLVQKPVYYPFFKSVEKNRRKVVNNPLVNNNGRYEVDFEDFEKKIANENVKLFLLCSPHTPVGRVWKYDELNKMGEICKKHGVIVISDEIHCEFTFGKRHIPFWHAGESFDDFSVICTSPSKAFNQAALSHANILIKDNGTRRTFQNEIAVSGLSNTNAMGLAACKAAYDYGFEWLVQLNEYLKGNIDFTKDFIEKNMPHIKITDIEGTYLMWLDFRTLGLSSSALDKLITEKANLWLDGGTKFGQEGEGFQRINIATPRSNLHIALENIKKALSS